MSKTDPSKKSTAVVVKVKKLFNGNIEYFREIYNKIKEKYEFVNSNDIDSKIYEAFSEIFRKDGIMQRVYYDRLSELLTYVTVEIMKKVNKGEPFILTHKRFSSEVEDICLRINNERSIRKYSNFRRSKLIDIKDSKICNTREYNQLCACNLEENLIVQHLIYKLYYEDFKYSCMENNHTDEVDDIEVTTFENFCSVKCRLINNGKDTPFNRLDETKKASNSYTANEQIRFGSGIYLTKDGTEPEIQISWRDDENV